MVIRDYESQLDFDLMTMTGRTLSEYLDMGAAGIVALCHFVQHLGAESTLVRSKSNVDMGAWGTSTHLEAMIADVYDAIANLNANVVQRGSKHKVKRPKPYPRPWNTNRRRIGKGAIPISAFADWWNSKSRKDGEDG